MLMIVLIHIYNDNDTTNNNHDDNNNTAMFVACEW